MNRLLPTFSSVEAGYGGTGAENPPRWLVSLPLRQQAASWRRDPVDGEPSSSPEYTAIGRAAEGDGRPAPVGPRCLPCHFPAPGWTGGGIVASRKATTGATTDANHNGPSISGNHRAISIARRIRFLRNQKSVRPARLNSGAPFGMETRPSRIRSETEHIFPKK